MDELLDYITERLKHIDSEEFGRDEVEEALALAVQDAEEAYLL